MAKRHFQPRGRRPLRAVSKQLPNITVRLVGPNGQNIGTMQVEEAVRHAQSMELDLVEISPDSSPPVYKIMDYGKYKYQQQKRLSESKKKQKLVLVKEVTVRPGIGEHDYAVKIGRVRSFLEHGDRVKVTIRLRGREMAYKKDITDSLHKRFTEALDSLGTVQLQAEAPRANLVQMMILPVKAGKQTPSSTPSPSSTPPPSSTPAPPTEPEE